MKEAHDVSSCNKRIVEDYYVRTHKATGVHSYVHKEWNKRFCQLYTAAHVRPLYHVRARALMRVRKCERIQSYGSRDSWITYVTFASVSCVCHSVCVCVRLCECVRGSLTPTRAMYGCRQPQFRGYFAEGSSSVQVES